MRWCAEMTHSSVPALGILWLVLPLLSCFLGKNCPVRSSCESDAISRASGQTINSSLSFCPITSYPGDRTEGVLIPLFHQTLSQPCLRTIPWYGLKWMPWTKLRPRGACSHQGLCFCRCVGLIIQWFWSVCSFVAYFVFLSPSQWLSP